MNMSRASGAAPTAGSEVSSLMGLHWVSVFFTYLVLLLHWGLMGEPMAAPYTCS